MPLSLQGLSLHSSGSVDFADVGGLTQAKQTLTETLLWPSKVSIASFPGLPSFFCSLVCVDGCGRVAHSSPLFRIRVLLSTQIEEQKEPEQG